MSRILEADCDAEGVVRCQGFVIEGARILTHGKQASQGILIIDGEAVTYLTANTDDLATTLEKVSAALDKAVAGLNKTAAALQTLDGAAFLVGATGAVPSPPLVASQISDIQSAASDISSTKGELDELKGKLK